MQHSRAGLLENLREQPRLNFGGHQVKLSNTQVRNTARQCAPFQRAMCLLNKALFWIFVTYYVTNLQKSPNSDATGCSYVYFLDGWVLCKT